MKTRSVSSVLAAIAVGLCGAAASGQTTLFDLNSTADFDTASQAGQHSWVVDGVNHMFQQWFWVRADGDASERSLDQLVPAGLTVLDTNPFTDPRNDKFDGLWHDRAAANRFDVELSVTLRGSTPGSNRSGLSELIRITNTSGTALPFHFFQYVDLDLNNTISDTSVQISSGAPPGPFNTARQNDGAFEVSETVTTPAPSFYEANFFAVTRTSLNDGAATTLNGNAGPLGPGDLTWAFQWDFNLAPGQTVEISKEKTLAPTPGTTSLLALGGLVLARRRRRA